MGAAPSASKSAKSPENALPFDIPVGLVPISGLQGAKFEHIRAMCLLPDGSIAVCDNNRICVVDLKTKQVKTVAGTDTWADNKEPSCFKDPMGIATDDKGNIFVADTVNHRICCVSNLTSKQPTVTTIAGGSIYSGSEDGAAQQAKFHYPKGLCYNTGKLYIGDSANYRVRCLDIEKKTVTTAAGQGWPVGYLDGDAAVAQFQYPTGVCLAAPSSSSTSGQTQHCLLICDMNNDAIRELNLETKAVRTVIKKRGKGITNPDESLRSPASIVPFCQAPAKDSTNSSDSKDTKSSTSNSDTGSYLIVENAGGVKFLHAASGSMSSLKFVPPNSKANDPPRIECLAMNRDTGTCYAATRTGLHIVQGLHQKLPQLVELHGLFARVALTQFANAFVKAGRIVVTDFAAIKEEELKQLIPLLGARLRFSRYVQQGYFPDTAPSVAQNAAVLAGTLAQLTKDPAPFVKEQITVEQLQRGEVPESVLRNWLTESQLKLLMDGIVRLDEPLADLYKVKLGSRVTNRHVTFIEAVDVKSSRPVLLKIRTSEHKAAFDLELELYQAKTEQPWLVPLLAHHEDFKGQDSPKSSLLVFDKPSATNSLQKLLPSLRQGKVEEKAPIMRGTATCLAQLHSLGYVWTDCKPDDFMVIIKDQNGDYLPEQQIRLLIDPARFVRIGERVPVNTSDSMRYFAPERAYDAKLVADPSLDIWSLAVCWLERWSDFTVPSSTEEHLNKLRTGHHLPWLPTSMLMMYAKESRDEQHPLRELIFGMIDHSPQKRPTMKEILANRVMTCGRRDPWMSQPTSVNTSAGSSDIKDQQALQQQQQQLDKASDVKDDAIGSPG